MKRHKNVYRKNFSLIIAFLALISVTFITALIVAYNLTAKYVENEFATRKGDVLEATVKPYNDFFLYRIPQITSYQGYLNASSAASYSDSVFKDYHFVKRVLFYDMTIGNKAGAARHSNNLAITLNSVFQYHQHNGVTITAQQSTAANATDFKYMANKLSDYIAFSDTSRSLTPDEILKTFYDVKPDKISYMNILRREDVKIYRELQKKVQPGATYRQNMMTFLLDPYSLKINNLHKELYQSIAIKPFVYYPLDNDAQSLTAEIGLPGAFSDYKLYFRSARGYLDAEVNRRFMPIGGAVLLIYCFLVLIGYLIYRNLQVNLRLFKLQYDFINNFTHEFKTPLSVIKIAGSNLRGDGILSERQLKHYGKILDEEADKLNDLMTKLLSFTQLENRSIDLKKEEIDLTEFTKRYVESFQIKYPDFKLHFKITGAKTINTDPVLLGSIFQNLMENAYKYSHRQKKDLYINIAGDRKSIVFSFIDKGIGIPKSELSNIFNKFYRLENQYNQNGSAGLGLAFCKELVNFMDGDITVSSKVDEGSAFIVTLPNDN